MSIEQLSSVRTSIQSLQTKARQVYVEKLTAIVRCKTAKNLLITLSKDSRRSLWLTLYAVARHTILIKMAVKSQGIISVLQKKLFNLRHIDIDIMHMFSFIYDRWLSRAKELYIVHLTAYRLDIDIPYMFFFMYAFLAITDSV